jgi:heptaprenyl diphosphate synthase
MRRALEQYGYNTGVAFQIVDDVLDFIAEQAQLGKPVGGDLRQGLFTLPALLYAERYAHEPDLKSLLEAQDGDHPAIERLIASIRHCGVIDEAMDEARELVAQGKRALQDLPYSAYRAALSSLADTIVERQA